MTATFQLLSTFAAAMGSLGTAASLSAQNNGPELNLAQTVERFMRAVDSGDTPTVAAMYDPTFTNVRVADEGAVVRLSREQVLQFLGRAKVNAIPTKDSTIHLVEEVGDHGFVLLTRTKDLGAGWEPMFYSLVWKKAGAEWRLLREFVHQRTLPKPR